MNVSRKLRALSAVVVIGLDPIRCCARGRIEVDTNKDRVPIGVRDSYSITQGNKNIAVPCHHHLVAGGAKSGSESLGNIEIHSLFGNALARNSAAIEPAVSGVNDHGLKSTGVGFGDEKKKPTSGKEGHEQLEEKSAPRAS